LTIDGWGVKTNHDLEYDNDNDNDSRFSYNSKLDFRISDLVLWISRLRRIGAGDGDRTRDVQLGKLTFYH
jgi:hypothetical protein